MTDDLNDFIEYDVVIGSDVVKCPKCGEVISSSLLFDDKVKCPKCECVFSK